VIDVRVSKCGTQASAEHRAGFHGITEGRLSHHSLCKQNEKMKAEQGTLKWGQHQLSGTGLHTTHSIKTTAAAKRLRSLLS